MLSFICEKSTTKTVSLFFQEGLQNKGTKIMYLKKYSLQKIFKAKFMSQEDFF